MVSFVSINFSAPSPLRPSPATTDRSPRSTSSPATTGWPELQHLHRHELHRKKFGKSRLQIVTTTGDNEADDEMSPRVPMMMGLGLVRDMNVQTKNNNNINHNDDNNSNSNALLVSSCVGVFSHPTPIKCLVTGVMGCSPVMLHKIYVEDSSVTMLQHSWRKKLHIC